MIRGNTIFGGLGKDGSVWGALVEKAFAKYYGNYERLLSGMMADAVSVLNGGPSESYDHYGSRSVTKDEMWDKIIAAKADGDIVTAASRNCGGNGSTTNQGIVCSHAYSVLKTHVLTDATGKTVARLLKVRNPWGREYYRGNWSDSSKLWTPEYVRQIE